MNLSERQTMLDLMRKTIASISAPERAKYEAARQSLIDAVEEHGDVGRIALIVLYTEHGIERETAPLAAEVMNAKVSAAGAMTAEVIAKAKATLQ